MNAKLAASCESCLSPRKTLCNLLLTQKSNLGLGLALTGVDVYICREKERLTMSQCVELTPTPILQLTLLSCFFSVSQI